MLVGQYTFQRESLFLQFFLLSFSLPFTQSLPKVHQQAFEACGVLDPIKKKKLQLHFNYTISVCLPSVLVLSVLMLEFEISPQSQNCSSGKSSVFCLIHKGGYLIFKEKVRSFNTPSLA